MNSQSKRLRTLASIGVAASLTSACASAVKHEDIPRKTAFALGLESEQISISNRVEDDAAVRYTVTTSSGKKYQCYIEGWYNVTGRHSSDAVCSEIGGSGGKAGGKAPGGTPGTCNALLKAAGKC
jgi:hypothetical protein